MTKEELINAGKYLYGDHWMAPLARDLGVNYSTIKRWKSGTVPISQVTAMAIEGLRAEEEKFVFVRKGNDRMRNPIAARLDEQARTGLLSSSDN